MYVSDEHSKKMVHSASLLFIPTHLPLLIANAVYWRLGCAFDLEKRAVDVSASLFYWLSFANIALTTLPAFLPRNKMRGSFLSE
jgi:hypothetical protein